ncbi:hypothetical protein D3C76_1124280 [compost metagenome]
MLRHGRIGEHLKPWRIGHAGHADTSGHVIFRSIRITDRLNIQQRLIWWPREYQLAFTHEQILTIRMETPRWNINLAMYSQTILVLCHTQIATQSGFQAKCIQTHVVTHADRQIAVDWDPCRRRLDRLELVIQHHFIRRNSDRAFWQLLHRDARPRDTYATIE